MMISGGDGNRWWQGGCGIRTFRRGGTLELVLRGKKIVWGIGTMGVLVGWGCGR